MKIKWSTQRRKIKDLIPFEKNPRKMDEKQIDDLRKSLDKFDLVEIPVIQPDGKIIAGHQRIKVLSLMGREEEEIEVRVPDRQLTEEEYKEYNLRSNKNVGEWDWDKLSEFDKTLLLDVGFDQDIINSFNADEVLIEQEEFLKEYNKTHILLSFDPELFLKLKPLIEQILLIEGIEYEQTSN